MSDVCVIMPMYNDWASAAKVVREIDGVAATWESAVTVLIVNDGSQEARPANGELAAGCGHLKGVQVIDLVCNQGHQRAIAIGLVYAQQKACFDRVFVMDSDGEDRPVELADLLAASQAHPDAIITADRVSRSEGALFKFCYRCYKFLFSTLTGTHIRFGNFCVIPAHQLARLIHYPSLWNSFSGTIKKANIPRQGIPSHRGTRYAGLSKMNFVALVLHGLSVISVFWDVLLVRLLCGLLMLWFISGAWVLAMLPIGLIGGVGLWGLAVWSILSVALGAVALFLLRHLNTRATAPFVPAWHTAAYISAVRELKS